MNRLPDRIASSYLLGDRLGAGAFAEVRRARHRDLEREVVLKIVEASSCDRQDEGMRARVVQEARTLLRLCHPNVVQLLDFEMSPTTLVLVYPYVEGRTLQAVTEAEAPLPGARVERLLRQLFEALEHVHEAGVLHRDLKPQNVLVGDADRLLVLDFGLALNAATVRRLTETGTWIGTPLYASPQVLKGEPASAEDDLYAAGVMAYELLTGENPFQGPTLANVWERHLSLDPPPPHEVEDAAPPALSHLTVRLLAKETRDRPRSAREALSILDEQVVSGASAEGSRSPAAWRGPVAATVAPPPAQAASPGDTGPARAGRRRQAVVLVLAGATALALGLLGSHGWHDEDDGPLVGSTAPETAAPPPAADGRGDPDPTGAGITAEDLTRLERLLEAGSGTDRAIPLWDPLAWRKLILTSPPIRNLYRWCREGGVSGALHPELRRRLVRLDRDLAARGAPRLLGPLLEAPPRRQYETEGSLVTRVASNYDAARSSLPERIGGHAAEALHAIEAAIRLRERRNSDLRAGRIEGYPQEVRRMWFTVVSQSDALWRLVAGTAKMEASRGRMAATLSEDLDLLWTAYAETARSLRTGESHARWAVLVLTAIDAPLRPYCLAPFLQVDPRVWLGGEARTQEEASLVGSIHHRRNQLLRTAWERVPSDLDAELQAWDATLSPDALDNFVGRLLSGLGLLRGFSVLEERKEGSALLVRLEDQWERILGLPPLLRAQVISVAVEGLLTSGSANELPSELRGDLGRELSGLRAAPAVLADPGLVGRIEGALGRLPPITPAFPSPDDRRSR